MSFRTTLVSNKCPPLRWSELQADLQEELLRQEGRYASGQKLIDWGVGGQGRTGPTCAWVR